MRKALIFLFLLVPGILLSQANDSSATRRLMMKIPFINGGLGFSIQPTRDLPVERSMTVESFGFGFWYFTRGKFSYQLDGNFKTVVHEYSSYSMINSNGTRTEQSRSYIRPQLIVGANYLLPITQSMNMYAFTQYQLLGSNWKGRNFIATGPGTVVNSPVVGQTQFDNVYDVYLTHKKLQHSIRTGFALSNSKNSVVARFWLDFTPAQNYTYVAESLGSNSQPDMNWTEKGKSDILFGFTFEFNTVLRGMSSF